MTKLQCPKCGEKFERNYFTWVWLAPFHCVQIEKPFRIRDKRYTKCPNCGKRSWMKAER
jgi:DNA-directed RNA polymerase subunit RPC12/RpoP